MNDTGKIIRSSRYIILLGCLCFFTYLTFLLVSYLSAVNRLERLFEESTFPRLTELIDHKIELFFKPSVKGLSLLSETLDWRLIMREAATNHTWLKSRMKAWASELEINSVGVSDRDRKIVWDYWSDDPVVLDPALPRDEWFFDFWRKEKKPDWTFTIYSEDQSKGYQMYIDRLIRDNNGRPIGSIAAQISLARLKEQLSQIIGEGERVVILDDRGNSVIDISRMEVGEGIKIFRFRDSTVKKNSVTTGGILTREILSQASGSGRLEQGGEKFFYKRTSLFNGAMSSLAVVNTSHQMYKEKNRLMKDLVVSFTSFTIFFSIVLMAMMKFTQRLKFLAIRLETGKSKFEDLLFIVTHSIGNEIHMLQKITAGITRKIPAGINTSLSEMSLMIQNSVNAARLDSSRALIISKPYDFSWQWEKLTGNFKPLSEGKGQKFLSSPAINCIINNDEEMVYQVLANLVSNAIKYAPLKGKVVLNARVEEGLLFITVKDSGPGFLQEDKDALFSKFKKLSAKPSGGERSTGIGLYIVKHLAEACDIKLELSQGEGELCGAVWKLELKIAQPGI